MATKKKLIWCTLCGFTPNQELTRGGQVRELRRHWRENEFKFKWYQGEYDTEELRTQMEAGMNIIGILWTELDEVTGPALEELREYKAWKSQQEQNEDPWSREPASALEIEDLKKQLSMANKFKVGRGLAIALYHMSQPYFENADEVVKHAVLRADAYMDAGAPDVFTPGTGAGQEADRAWLEQKRAVGRPAPVDVPPLVAPQPVQEPVEKAPATDAPSFGDKILPPDDMPILTQPQLDAIKNAVAGGMPVEKLAEVYQVPLDKLQSVLA